MTKASERNILPSCFVKFALIVYLSRDFLHNNVVTNDLVNDHEACVWIL